ncbi:MAG: ExeM/NucH family extracellular endonuclease [Verrucomicrobiales bacterium]|nr:ExeM/NucH family extracellular endonuclease [Verrucomicrobiales bacterium]
MASMGVALGLPLAGAWAQTALDYSGGLLQQDFDTLPRQGAFTLPVKGPLELTATPIDATGMMGWAMYANLGPSLRFEVSDGISSTSTTASFGLPGDVDRALGGISSSAYKARVGLLLRNTTGQTLTQFTLAYAAEQWRYSGTGVNTATFSYRIASTPPVLDSTAGLTVVPALSMTSPVTSGAVGARNGNASENRTWLSHTVTGISWPDGQYLMLRWQDEDDAGSPDDALAVDDLLFFAPATPAAAPQVVSMWPENGRSLVLTDAEGVVGFSEPVAAAAGAFELTGSVSGTLAVTVSGGPLRYEVRATQPFAAGETVTLRVVAAAVTSNQSAAVLPADVTSSFTVLPDAASVVLPIHTVQGAGMVSPALGGVVTIEGVVTAAFQGGYPALGGFFLQEGDADADADVATSEGLWVYDAAMAAPTIVSVGDRVRVTGRVAEHEGVTEIDTPTSVTVLGSAALPTPAIVSLPQVEAFALERAEGMQVVFDSALVVTSNEELGSRGELVLSQGGVLLTPTETLDPADLVGIRAAQAAQARNRVTLDDGSGAYYPDPTPFLNASATRRCGDRIPALAGMLTETPGGYRVQPVTSVVFEDANPRPSTPAPRSGRLRVAAMNVLNFFLTLNERGANTPTELQRQRDKLIPALVGLDADVVGLIEVEQGSAALSDLLSALNAAIPPGADAYTSVPPPVLGTGGDAIRLAVIYRSSKVTPIGAAETDDDLVWNTPDPLRPPWIQLFEEVASGERFFVALNHFKSKGSAPTSQAQQTNFDQGDGQGAWNALRVQQAQRLAVLLAGLRQARGDHDVLILGDLNSYGREDPITSLIGAGYADQAAVWSPGDISYRRSGEAGRLDHALATATMASQIRAVSHWAINADEPPFYDYNEEYKGAAQLAINIGTPFRSSDHDPILIDLDPSPQPTTYAMWAASILWPLTADSSPTADGDADGMSNLLEFACRTDPLVPSINPTTAGRSPADLTLTYPLRSNAQGLLVEPIWSENLINWQVMTTAAPVLTLDPLTVLWQASQPHDNAAWRFARLRVSLLP